MFGRAISWVQRATVKCASQQSHSPSLSLQDLSLLARCLRRGMSGKSPRRMHAELHAVVDVRVMAEDVAEDMPLREAMLIQLL